MSSIDNSGAAVDTTTAGGSPASHVTGTKVNLAWAAAASPGNTQAGFTIARWQAEPGAPAGRSWVKIGAGGLAATSFQDNTLTSSFFGAQQYLICSVNLAGRACPSASVVTSPPGVPTGLTGTRNSSTSITLNWTAPSPANEAGFAIYRWNGTTWTRIKLQDVHTTATASGTYTDTSAATGCASQAAGCAQSYFVSSFNQFGATATTLITVS